MSTNGITDQTEAPPPVEGDRLPDFALPTAGGGHLAADGLRGRKLILFCYPKADTSGCTREARDFQAECDRLGEQAPLVVGVSRDPVARLDAFAAKADLRFPLISDEQGVLVQALGAWVEKSMYGRTYMGVERCTFLVDADGIIRRVWRRVKIPGHAAAAMKAAAALPNRSVN